MYIGTQKHSLQNLSPVLKNDTLPALTNFQKRQGRLFNAPRRTHEFVKEFSSKHQGLFQKVLHLFEKVLACPKYQFFFKKLSFRFPTFQKQQREIETNKGKIGKELIGKPYPFGQTSVCQRSKELNRKEQHDKINRMSGNQTGHRLHHIPYSLKSIRGISINHT